MKPILTISKLRVVTIALSVLVLTASSAAVCAESLPSPIVVTSQGGNTEKVYTKAVYDSFSKRTDVVVQSVALKSEEAFARMIAEASAPGIDLYQFTGGQEVETKKRDLGQDIGDLGGVKVPAKFIDPDNKWVAVASVASGILYNTKHIKTPPVSLKDFLKPEYKGKIGLAALTNAKGMDFMIMLSKAYGGDERNTDVGMEKIGELLKGGAKVFSVASQMKTMFAQDEIWLAYYDVANARNAMKQGMPVAFTAPKEGMSVQLVTNVIAKNSKKGDTARAAIALALSLESQTALAANLGWFPSNPKAKLPDEVNAELKLRDEDMKKLVVLDRAYMATQKPEWIEGFNRLATR